MTNDNSVDGHPRIPYGVLKEEAEESNDQEETSESAGGDGSVLEDSDVLEENLSENALQSVTLEGPVTADTIRDITPTSITLGAKVTTTSDEDLRENVCSLANAATCVRKDGSTKVNGRYVPETLQFEKTFQFENSVETIDELRSELQEIFGQGISIEETE